MGLRFLLKTISALLLFAILGGFYFWQIRPRLMHWGATPAECARSMPEDQSVSSPVFDATRAITIHARPEEIFPWLLQMGFGRAGFYGYDLIENLGSGSGIRSANTIIPTLQNPKPGDPLPLSVAATLVYSSIGRNQFVVWKSRNDPCDGVFIWELVPIDANNTRLISRIRWNYVKSPGGFALGLFTEFTDHVAVRKILNGVRDRAEGRPTETLTHEAIEIASWFASLLNLAIALFYIAFWRKWASAWLLALGAGFAFQFVLYSSVPLFIRTALVCLCLVGLAVARMRFGKNENAHVHHLQSHCTE